MENIKNIFRGHSFPDVFVLRCGKKAVFDRLSKTNTRAFLYNNELGFICVHINGKALVNDKSDNDVVAFINSNNDNIIHYD